VRDPLTKVNVLVLATCPTLLPICAGLSHTGGFLIPKTLRITPDLVSGTFGSSFLIVSPERHPLSLTPYDLSFGPCSSLIFSFSPRSGQHVLCHPLSTSYRRSRRAVKRSIDCSPIDYGTLRTALRRRFFLRTSPVLTDPPPKKELPSPVASPDRSTRL